jgi:energy-coupling factor transporter ATP-binding protein EcfA2
MRVILCGRMGSGKTTIAKMLSQIDGSPVVSLATEVKHLTAMLLRCKTVAQATKMFYSILTPKLKEKALLERNVPLLINFLEDFFLYEQEDGKPRKHLQYVGNSLRVILDEDIWVELLAPTLHKLKGFYIDDCRYPNEAQISDWYDDALLVRLNIPPSIQKERLVKIYPNFSDSWLKHESEDLVDSVRVDLDIDATDTPENIVKEILNNVKKT